MKAQEPRQYAGVWLDNQQAMIISKDISNSESGFAISGKVQAAATQGGGSEHSMNNAKHSHQLKYLKELAQLLMPFDEILIFGPGQSQEQLQNHLKEDAQFNHKKITIDSSDQLTDPQRIARVRDYFHLHQS